MRDKLYTPTEAAMMMGYCPAWVYRLLTTDRLRSTPVIGSSRLWVSRASMVDYLAKYGKPPYPRSLRQSIIELQGQ